VVLSGNQDKRFQEIQLKNERINTAAGAIRHTDQSLEALGQKIDALKGPLDTIVKNFPPFSAQDQARMKLMMKYSTLRKEIDQLTLPPPPDVVTARKAQSLTSPRPLDATNSQIADHVTNLATAGAALNSIRAGLAADTASLLHDGRFLHIFYQTGSVGTARSAPPLAEAAAAKISVQIGRQFASVVSHGVTPDSSQFLRKLS
jgi:hypothetical protein